MLKKLIECYLQQKRHRGKTRLVRLLLSLLPYRSIRTHYGVILSANPCDKTNIYAIAGDYGHVISRHIQSLPTDCTFIDIGANYGLYSNFAGKHLTNGKVYSFEPNPYIYRHYLMALEQNGFRNITPFHCAIGDQDGFLCLSFDKKHSGVSCLQAQAASNSNSFTVPVFDISKWDVLSLLNDQKEIHIKIDVEGYETSIIHVLQKCSWFGNIKSIIIEIDNENLTRFGSNAAKLYEAMKNGGFTSTIGIDPSRHYDEIFVK